MNDTPRTAVADYAGQLETENQIFRRLLFASHYCHGVYGDDGEMQCSGCNIDFKRDAAAVIEARVQQKALERSAQFMADSKEAGFDDVFKYAEHILKQRVVLGFAPGIVERLDAFLKANGHG